MLLYARNENSPLIYLYDTWWKKYMSQSFLSVGLEDLVVVVFSTLV